jgi:hypothetical protein
MDSRPERYGALSGLSSNLAQRTLTPGIDQRLNVLGINREWILPTSQRGDLKARSIFTPNDTFRLDVRVTAKECPPIDISIKVLVGEQTILRQQNKLPIPVVVGRIPE